MAHYTIFYNLLITQYWRDTIVSMRNSVAMSNAQVICICYPLLAESLLIYKDMFSWVSSIQIFNAF